MSNLLRHMYCLRFLLLFYLFDFNCACFPIKRMVINVVYLTIRKPLSIHFLCKAFFNNVLQTSCRSSASNYTLYPLFSGDVWLFGWCAKVEALGEVPLGEKKNELWLGKTSKPALPHPGTPMLMENSEVTLMYELNWSCFWWLRIVLWDKRCDWMYSCEVNHNIWCLFSEKLLDEIIGDARS